MDRDRERNGSNWEERHGGGAETEKETGQIGRKGREGEGAESEAGRGREGGKKDISVTVCPLCREPRNIKANRRHHHHHRLNNNNRRRKRRRILLCKIERKEQITFFVYMQIVWFVQFQFFIFFIERVGSTVTCFIVIVIVC